MNPRSSPPFDPWLWLQAFQETWQAAADPMRTGRRLRRERLARLIDSATRNSPLYARRARGARTLADIEPIGKPELMRHFDEWATDPRITRRAVEHFLRSAAPADAWFGRYVVWTSSGTSGAPGIFVQDAASLAAYDAIDTLRLRGADPAQPALGFWGVGRRFAYVAATTGHYAGYTSIERLRRIALPPLRPRIRAFSILDPLHVTLRELQAFDPHVLITYPSYAMVLAAQQASGALQLALDELWLGGEQLTAAQRDALHRAWGCAIRNNYGASEFYSIACECRAGRLHLNDDWVILEGIDAHGRPVPPDELSRAVLLTNLANHTHPLLRYTLDDRVRFVTAPCPCGCELPVIEVHGRSDDALELPGAHGDTVTLLPLALETVLEEAAGVTQFQLLLHADKVLELRLPGGPAGAQPVFERCRRTLHAHLDRQGVQPMRIVSGRCAPVRERGSGKLRRVVDLTRGPAAAHAARRDPDQLVH